MKKNDIAKVNRDGNTTSLSPEFRPVIAKYLSPEGILFDSEAPSVELSETNALRSGKVTNSTPAHDKSEGGSVKTGT